MKTADIVSLDAHENMTPRECLEREARMHEHYSDVIVVGYDNDGDVSVRSSKISRADAAFLLMAALDYVRKA